MSGRWHVTSSGERQWAPHPLYGNPSGSYSLDDAEWLERALTRLTELAA